MYYNRILRVWVVDPLDYFLVSAILGSIAGSYLKNYLSEKKTMERLKNSIINKSKLLNPSNGSVSNPTNPKKINNIYKIYRFALGSRGGDFEGLAKDHQFSNEVFKLAQKIKGLVERLARFLKKRELKGIAKIFFKNNRLILELILYKCRINITYSLLTEGLSTQVIVITATAGGAAGFTLSWFSAGASLVAPPVLISMLLIRSVAQQIVNQRDYLKFKMLINQMLQDHNLKETVRAVFMQGETPQTSTIQMEPLDSVKNSLPDFNVKSDQTLDEFVKDRMKEELGLVENPTPEQLKEIISKNTERIKKKPRGKTVYYRDFINEIPEDQIIDAEIIDAEIVKEPVKIKIKNEKL